MPIGMALELARDGHPQSF